MIRWIRRMPLAHRVVFFIAVGAMLAGNFARDSRAFFPFVQWDIFAFAREEDPITCREFWAATASGGGVRLLAEQLFPSIVQFNPPAQDHSPAMTHLVEALANQYNRQHPRDPVRQVDLVSVAVKLHPGAPPAPPACRILAHYEISSDR
jgi:hypothetical protein